MLAHEYREATAKAEKPAESATPCYRNSNFCNTVHSNRKSGLKLEIAPARKDDFTPQPKRLKGKGTASIVIQQGHLCTP